MAQPPIDAPTGRCPNCDSDDLMRHRVGDAVEYGVDWVIPRLLADNVQSSATDEMFEDSMRSRFGGAVNTRKYRSILLDTKLPVTSFAMGGMGGMM